MSDERKGEVGPATEADEQWLIETYGKGSDELADEAERGYDVGRMRPRVWVLDFSAEGPEAGDYTGYQSVHATKTGALRRLQGYLLDFAPVWRVSGADADNGSVAEDLKAGNGADISYGIHNMPVED